MFFEDFDSVTVFCLLFGTIAATETAKCYLVGLPPEPDPKLGIGGGG